MICLHSSGAPRRACGHSGCDRPRSQPLDSLPNEVLQAWGLCFPWPAPSRALSGPGLCVQTFSVYFPARWKGRSRKKPWTQQGMALSGLALCPLF